jgi:hypothetical protein
LGSVVLVIRRNRGYFAPVKEYRPNVERQKMLYSMEKSRKVPRALAPTFSAGVVGKGAHI